MLSRARQDRTTTLATSFEEECGNKTAPHHKTTPFKYDHVYDNTSTRAACVKAGALVPSPPCLGGGITRVGPGQWEAAGSSLHREPQDDRDTADDEPNTLHKTYEWRMVTERHDVSDPHHKVVPRPQKLSAPQSRGERECRVLRAAP